MLLLNTTPHLKGHGLLGEMVDSRSGQEIYTYKVLGASWASKPGKSGDRCAAYKPKLDNLSIKKGDGGHASG